MRIIQPGKPPAEKEYEGTCRSCGAVIIAKRSEGQWREAYEQREPGYLAVSCPTVGCAGSIACFERREATAEDYYNK